MILCEFFAPGTPTPQGSKRIGRNHATGHPVLINDNDAKLKAWRLTVAQVARFRYRGEPFDGAVRVEATFYLPRPQRLARKLVAPPHTTKPDLDKLARGLLDALTEAGILTDDSRVAALLVTKRYASPPEQEPGAHVTVRAAEPEETP